MVPAMESPPTVPVTVAAIGDWVRRCGRSYTAIAVEIDVDEKSVRQAARENWNPRASTLGKFEKLIPSGWREGDPIPAAEGASATASAGVSA
jgi:hypothetical protein